MILALNPDPRGPPLVLAPCPCGACRVIAAKPKESSK